MYKAILKPMWSYGVQLWGCPKPSNTKIIQRVQSKILRMVFNAPRYISNKTLHEDSGTPFVEYEIKRLSVDKKNQLDVTFVYFISLLIVAQHVSGNHVPIIRS